MYQFTSLEAQWPFFSFFFSLQCSQAMESVDLRPGVQRGITFPCLGIDDSLWPPSPVLPSATTNLSSVAGFWGTEPACTLASPKMGPSLGLLPEPLSSSSQGSNVCRAPGSPCPLCRRRLVKQTNHRHAKQNTTTPPRAEPMTRPAIAPGDRIRSSFVDLAAAAIGVMNCAVGTTSEVSCRLDVMVRILVAPVHAALTVTVST